MRQLALTLVVTVLVGCQGESGKRVAEEPTSDPEALQEPLADPGAGNRGWVRMKPRDESPDGSLVEAEIERLQALGYVSGSRPPREGLSGVTLNDPERTTPGLNLVLYVALEKLYRRKRFDGQVFGLYLIAYAVLRVVVELFRGDYGANTLGIFTPGQVISAGILTAGVTILWVQSRAARRKGQA